MEKIEIDINKPLNPGDVIELHFFTSGMLWITAGQIAIIEWQLEKRKDFRIMSHTLPGINLVVFEVKVLKTNPVIVTAAVIGAAIIGAGVLAWLTLDKVYQILESPIGKEVIKGTAISLSVMAVIAVLILLKE